MFGLDKLIDILFGFLSALFGSLFEPLADFFVPFTDLIFGQEGESLLYSTFTVDEFTKTVNPGMELTQTIAGFFLFASFLLAIIRLSSTGLNPSNRTALLEFFKDWFLVTIVFLNLTTVYDFILTINSSIVEVFKGAISSTDDPFNFFADTIDELKNAEGNKSLLSWIVLQLVQLGLSIWASFYYLMRKFTLIILMILGPIFISLWMFPQFKGLTMNYFKEFIGTTLTQAIHALLFWLITMISFSSSGIETVLLMVIFIPTSEAIRSLLGTSSNMTGTMNKAGAMFGMSALAGMYGSVKGALDGKGVFESIKSAGSKAKEQYNNSKNGANDPSADDMKATSGVANAGSTLGSTDRAERMLKAGEILSKGGKMIGGMAGTLVGSPMGPAGSITGGTLGSIAGGVSGGLTGRAGYAIGSTLKRGIQDGLLKAKEGPKDLADALAEEKTHLWATQNEEQFKEDLKKRGFDEAEREALWNTEKNNKFNAFKKETEQDLKGIPYDSSEGKVADLRQKAAEDLTNEWEKQHKEDFIQTAKNGEVNLSDQDIETLWRQKVNEKQREHLELVQSTPSQSMEKEQLINHMAQNMTRKQKEQFMHKQKQQVEANGQVFDKAKAESTWVGMEDKVYKDNIVEAQALVSSQEGKTFTTKEEFANAIGQEKMKQWVASHPTSQNLSSKQKQEKLNGFVKEANILLQGYSPTARSSILVEETATAMTDEWAKTNEAAFKNNLKQGEKPLSDTQIETLWKQEKGKKLRENYKVAEVAAMKTHQELGRKDITYSSQTFIPKETFKNNLYQAKQAQDKIDFTNELQQQNPGMSSQAIEEAWINKVSSDSKINNTRNIIERSVNSVKGGPLITKGSINKEALATHLAHNQTERQKQAFFNSQKEGAESKGIAFNETLVKQEWDQRENLIYQDNLKEANMLIDRQAGKQIIRKEQGKIHGTGRLGKAELGLQSVGRFVSGTAQGVKIHSGAQAIIDDFKDSKVGKFIDAAGAGYSIGLQEANIKNAEMVAYTAGDAIVQPFEKLSNKIIKPSHNALKQGFTAFKQHRSENPIERQVNYRNRSAFMGGLIGGEGGHTQGALLANKISPYKSAAQQQALEIKQILQQVETESSAFHPTGKVVADGALQLVIDQNQSFIQMRNKQGEVKKVSITGAGDSKLQKGQVAYQNLTINQEGMMEAKGQVYTLDYTGGKVALSHQPNINAQRLVGNHSTIKIKQKPNPEQVYIPMNAKVDAGQFTIQHIKTTNTDNKVTVVYENDKSYVIQKDSNGKQYRVSQYGPGEPSLKPGQRLYSNREIVGGKLAKTSNVMGETYFFDQEGVRHVTTMEPTVDINTIIPQRENKRYIARQQAEQNRKKYVLSGSNRVV